MDKKNKSPFIFLRVGIVGSVIFGYIGYLFGAALNLVTEDSVGFLDAFLRTIAKPSSRTFNQYSPITILIGIIVFETVYTAVMLCLNQEEDPSEPEMGQPNVMNEVDLHDLMEEEPKKEEIADQSLFPNIFRKEDHTGTQAEQAFVDIKAIGVPETKPEPEKADVHEVEDEISLSAEVTEALVGNGYTLEQVRAMTEICRYMKDITADMLMQMFKKSMEPDRITRFIRSFYKYRRVIHE